MARTAERMAGSTTNMPGLHCAPFWARMCGLREHTPLTAMIDKEAALKDWLDATIVLPAVLETLPDREKTVQSYRDRYVGATKT